jgi:hypothetical protein
MGRVFAVSHEQALLRRRRSHENCLIQIACQFENL